MTSQDLFLVAMLFLGVAGLAYVLGRRRTVVTQADAPPKSAERREARSSSSELAPSSSSSSASPKASKAAAEDEPSDSNDTVAKLTHDEDEDEDITRVGMRSGPPGKGQRTIYQPPIKRIIFDPEAEVDEPTGASSMFLVYATAETDTGLRRKRNEDSLLVVPSANLFVVADGMGGYRGGELASQLAVQAIGAAIKSGNFEGPPHEGEPREASELARAIQMANADIQEAAQAKPDLAGMGTTVCAARFSPTKERLHIGHVGDSRCYRLRDGVFKSMTADHTMADHGVTGPESGHLSRAVGIWPTVPIDIVSAVPQPGDVYLLCSDGLTKMLTDEIIGTVLRSEDDPKAAVDRLILFANSRGGKDNITVVLVRVVTPNWKPRPSQTNEGGLAQK